MCFLNSRGKLILLLEGILEICFANLYQGNILMFFFYRFTIKLNHYSEKQESDVIKTYMYHVY